MITTSFFVGGIIIGLIGCSDYADAKSNGIVFLLIPLSLLTLVFSASFTVTAGVAAALSSIFSSKTGSSSSTNSSAVYQSANSSTPTVGSSSNQAMFSSVIAILEFIIFLILIPLATIGGCYLGVFIKKYWNKN
ncbi:MAG: hypothetical protein ACRC1M_00080 [Methanobacteriaceae archaeon]